MDRRTRRTRRAGYAPFSVQVIGHRLSVAYAKADPATGKNRTFPGEARHRRLHLQGRLDIRTGTKHTLIFAAGVEDETHGLLGAITPAG